MQITFHGAAGSVTGSRHLVEAGGRRILLDCGLVQGRRDEAEASNRSLGFDAADLDAVVLSHAHIDHSGALPMLVRQGFGGTIHSTRATADLCSFMLRDSAHLQEKDAEFANKRMARRRSSQPPRQPLYTVEDAERTMGHFAGHAYYHPFQVAPGVEAQFHDAGHILGSAIVSLTLRENGEERSVVFSGDLGRAQLPIIRDPDLVPAHDVLIVESTYGDRTHDPVDQAAEKLAAVVQRVVERRGKLIIPAFAVGRTQEIVYELSALATAGRIPRCPIFIDSPMAVEATDAFRRHPECFDQQTMERLGQQDDPFGLGRMLYVRSVEESMALNTRPGPFIIISASGMMEGGRVLHHLRNSISEPRNAILIVGFQAENTLGRRILRGDPVVNIFGEPHECRAEVIVMNEYSAHADRDEILRWFQASRSGPQDILVVHGEAEQSAALAERLGRETTARIQLPTLHETLGLGGSHGRGRHAPAASPGHEAASDATDAGDAGRKGHSSRRSRRGEEHQGPRRQPGRRTGRRGHR